MKRLLLIVPLALFALLSVFLLRGLFADPTELSSARVGQPLPTFSLPDLLVEGRTLTPADLPAGPLLLNVWATWCPTCYAEHQYLNQLAGQGVPIIGLVYKDDDAKARRWLDELGNPYQLVVNDESGRYGIDLGVYGAPETYLLDHQHRIVYRHVGDVNGEVWATTLAPLWQQLKQEAK